MAILDSKIYHSVILRHSLIDRSQFVQTLNLTTLPYPLALQLVFSQLSTSGDLIFNQPDGKFRPDLQRRLSRDFGRGIGKPQPVTLPPKIIISISSIYLKGTTLENVFHQDISSPLWSAKPIDENPEIITQAHLAFLRAGARVILTSTCV